MKCAKCGLELLQGTKQCPKCGLINEFEQVAPAPRRKPGPILYATIALAVVGILALVVWAIALRGGSVTSAPEGASLGHNITSAPPGQPSGGGVTLAPPGKPGPTGQTPPGTTKPKPPQEVVDYLNYVKQVEEHRQMLLKDTTEALMLSASGGGTKGLMDMIDMAMDPEGKQAQDPLADTKAELNRQYKNWLVTLQYFEKKPAPPQCRQFSGAYHDVLYKETKAISDIAASFNSVNIMNPQDMSKLLNDLQKMKGDPSIQGNIDKAADNADGQLNQIVAQYDMQKPFDVPREKQGGNIMGF